MSNSIKCIPLDKSTDTKAAWDALVSSSPNGAIYHKTFWLDGWDGNYDLWGIYKGDTIVAGLSVPYRQLGPIRYATLPLLTPYAGILFAKHNGKYVNRAGANKRLAGELASVLMKNYKWGVSAFHVSVIDLQPFIWNGFKVSISYTYIMDVSNVNEVKRNMHYDTRGSIRKALKDGLKISTSDSLDESIGLIKSTYRRQNIMDIWSADMEAAYKYHEQLIKRDFYKGFICTDQCGNRIATYCIVWDEKRAYGFLSGYDSSQKHRGSVSLCVWEAIKFISEELGYKEFDFEGSMIPKIERFNRYFGGVLTPYYTLTWGKGIEFFLKANKMMQSLRH